MAEIKSKAKIIKAEDVSKLRYPIPESWKKAAGMLKGRKIDAVKYQRKIRQEWETRLKKLERQLRSGH